MELSSLNFTEKSDAPQRFPVIHPQTLKPMGWDLDILGPDATKSTNSCSMSGTRSTSASDVP